MKKSMYLILLVLILLVVSGIWYVKVSKAAKLFSYENIIYSCEEIQKAISQSTVIKVIQGTNGIITLTHEGQEYKCKITTGGNKKADVVLGGNENNVKLVLSDKQGNDVEVRGGQVKIGTDGNAVVVNERGTNIQLKNGGIVEIGVNGDVNIDIPGSGSVKTGGGRTQIKTNDADVDVGGGKVNIKTPKANVNTGNGSINVYTPETGNIKIDGNGVSVPGVNIPSF